MRGLIYATLADGRACCAVEERGAAGSHSLTIERDIYSEPRLYREGVKELSDASVLDRIEIYSQGDLQRIAEDDGRRLELIDRAHKATITRLKVQRDEAAKQLRELGPAIRERRAEIESRRAEVRGLEALCTQLTELQAARPSLSKELDREREAFLTRKGFLEALEDALRGRSALLARLRDAVAQPPNCAALLGQLRELDLPEAVDLRTELERYAMVTARIHREAGDLARYDPAPAVEAVRRRLEEMNASYYALRQDQQAANESLKREDVLKQQIAHLQRMKGELDSLEGDLRRLTARRQECRETIRRISDEIFSLRLREVDDINARHVDVVILNLEQGVRSPGYAEKLAQLLRGSNLRNQSEVVRDLAEKVRPADVIDIVESAEAGRLASLLGRDLGQMTRLVTFLDSPGLYELEGVPVEDRLEITMYDEGVPKPVGQLSKGQMATALLPLILRPAEYPLIFDQPEDDLDNRFIYKTLVQIVRDLKQQRQLIFVTHNANIPVLGEADAVIVMRMESPVKAAPPLIGSVDEVKEHILTLLEGGKDAFRRRQQQYADLLD
jgi:hypothetical protein